MKKLGILFVLALLLGTTVTTEYKLRSMDRADPLGRELLYVPTFRAVKLLSLGNEGMAADIFYLWAIQYYSVFIPNEQFLYINSMFDLITDLDPLYFEAYTLGGMLMAMAGTRDPEQHRDAVIALYDKGLAAMPNDFRLGEIAAWDFHTIWKDDQVATRFLEKVKDRPEVPSRIARVLGRWRDGASLWSYDESIDYWNQAVADSIDERDRVYARSHLYDSIAERDRSILDPMLQTQRIVTGECPDSFAVFVKRGVLKSLPIDDWGNPYLIDSEKCTVMPFKRIRRK